MGGLSAKNVNVVRVSPVALKFQNIKTKFEKKN